MNVWGSTKARINKRTSETVTAIVSLLPVTSLSSCRSKRIMTVNETAVIRWDYGDPVLGTCKESIEGGNHFRYWIQNGGDANTCVIILLRRRIFVLARVKSLLMLTRGCSGAVFMATSYEEPSTSTSAP